MDKEELILTLLKEQKDNTAQQIKAVQSNLDAGFELLAEEMRKITAAKKVQNGRVDKLEKVTSINRFLYKNPRLSIMIGVFAWYLVSQLFEIISIADLIKKL